MPARLFCKTGELAGLEFTIDREAVIGRLHENEVTLHPTFISGRHARIFFDDAENHYFLEDLGSSNGTRVDGMEVTEPTRLDELHILTFAGKFDFIFQMLSELPVSAPRAPGAGETTRIGSFFDILPSLGSEEPDEPGNKTHYAGSFGALPSIPDQPLLADQPLPEDKTHYADSFGALPPLPDLPLPEGETIDGTPFNPTPPLPADPANLGNDETILTPLPTGRPIAPLAPRKPVSPTLPIDFETTTPFVLDVTMPDGTRKIFALKEGPNVVGRQPTSDITLPDRSLSRSHAVLTVQHDTVLLKDLGSKNATFVEEEKVMGEITLAPGTPIAFGFNIRATLQRKP